MRKDDAENDPRGIRILSLAFQPFRRAPPAFLMKERPSSLSLRLEQISELGISPLDAVSGTTVLAGPGEKTLPAQISAGGPFTPSEPRSFLRCRSHSRRLPQNVSVLCTLSVSHRQLYCSLSPSLGPVGKVVMIFGSCSRHCGIWVGWPYCSALA
jgi:hypothetical protein